MRILILLSILVLSFQAIHDVDQNQNRTEKVSDYLTNNTIMNTISGSWHNFTNSIYEFFHHKHPKTGTVEDLQQQVREFSDKISDYFSKNFPEENMTQLVDRFSDRISYFMRRAGMRNETMSNFTEKFSDFSQNISDWLKVGMENMTQPDVNVTESLTNFLQKIGNYFNSNYTDFNQYIEECKRGVCPDVMENLPSTYQVIYHYHRRYRKPHGVTQNCNSEMLDKCGHKCMENKKVLCDCYFVNNNVDCVCADSIAMCDIKHTHTDM